MVSNSVRVAECQYFLKELIKVNLTFSFLHAYVFINVMSVIFQREFGSDCASFWSLPTSYFLKRPTESKNKNAILRFLCVFRSPMRL